MEGLKELPGALLPWYYVNRRDLPWRSDREPYHVWLSEIMLQQTRVEAVKGYYLRFLQALPTLKDLAFCREEQLLKLWEGLGYYNRARNLQKASRIILEQYGGEFPRSYQQVLALPGIGEYTAGAICSICFDLPTPGVDGNVLRVVSRITENFTPIDNPGYKKAVRQALVEIYPQATGDFTQALMELGATVCGPNRKPDCENCPCKDFCGGYLHGTAEKLPVKGAKKPRKEEARTVFILSSQGKYALQKRREKGLLASMWQFPNVPGHLELEDAVQAVQGLGISVSHIYRQTEKTHIFTHIQWNLRGFYLEAAEPSGDVIWMDEQAIAAQAALPTAFRQFWEDRLDV